MTDQEATGLARHDLLRVAPEAWAECLAGRSDLDGVAHLAGWAQLGRPVIVRRRDPGEASDRIPVGLPLPPGDGKRRIGLAVPAAAVSRHPAVSLAEARGAAPPAWRPVLDGLIVLGTEFGLVPRIFGGLLWQALTGLAYLGAGSDLDLLWPVPGPVDRRFLHALARIEADAPMRLDGEIVLPGGAGINWRELFEVPEQGTVLAKMRESLALRPAAPLLSRASA